MRTSTGVAPATIVARAEPSRALRQSAPEPLACSWQAIAKAETVSGNAARLGRSVHLCLCKTPGQDRLAALLLLVRSGEPCGAANGCLLPCRGERSRVSFDAR